jgi:hypothetical protein
MCVHVCAMHVHTVAKETRRGHGRPGAEVTGSWAAPQGHWEASVGPLQEEHMLLTDLSSLQSPTFSTTNKKDTVHFFVIHLCRTHGLCRIYFWTRLWNWRKTVCYFSHLICTHTLSLWTFLLYTLSPAHTPLYILPMRTHSSIHTPPYIAHKIFLLLKTGE